MAATETTPLPTGAEHYDTEDLYDEAFAAPGEPRDQYRELLGRLAETDLDDLQRDVEDHVDDAGCRFGLGADAPPFVVDAVPRVLTAQEWAPLAAGLEQRVRALDAFLADVYGPQRACAEGVVPERVVRAATYYEPELRELPAPRLRVGLAGLDVVRTRRGEFAVLEDNLRTPSGLAYAFMARRAVARRLAPPTPPRPIEERAIALLGRALRAAAPDGRDEPVVVLLTDGPENTAYWEHQRLAERLGIALVTPADLHTERDRLVARGREVDVVYRRTNADSLRDPETGELTPVGAALLEPLRAGTVACVNALGNGAADDKLVHAYVEDMVRFYLGEEPLIRSVPTYDLQRPGCLEEVLDRMEEMVVKPRDGYGGAGVFVGPHAEPRDRDRVAAAISSAPASFIAQETVFFSRHPTIVDGRLEPRHVDLRAVIFFDGRRAETLPGGLTRVALEEGELVVNSSKGGGAKDTWVLP